MSTALLAVQQRAQLPGIVSAAQLQDLPHTFESLSESQQVAIRKTYNDAFTKTMMICAIVASVGVILTTGTYRQGRVSLSEQRAQMVRDEIARRQKQHVLHSKGPVSSKSSGKSGRTEVEALG